MLSIKKHQSSYVPLEGLEIQDEESGNTHLRYWDYFSRHVSSQTYKNEGRFANSEIKEVSVVTTTFLSGEGDFWDADEAEFAMLKSVQEMTPLPKGVNVFDLNLHEFCMRDKLKKKMQKMSDLEMQKHWKKRMVDKLKKVRSESLSGVVIGELSSPTLKPSDVHADVVLNVYKMKKSFWQGLMKHGNHYLVDCTVTTREEKTISWSTAKKIRIKEKPMAEPLKGTETEEIIVEREKRIMEKFKQKTHMDMDEVRMRLLQDCGLA